MTEAKLVILVDLDNPLVPAIHAHHRLMDRQSIEELVGQNDRWTLRHLLQGLVPFHRYIGVRKCVALQLCERWTDLHEMDRDGLAEFGSPFPS